MVSLIMPNTEVEPFEDVYMLGSSRRVWIGMLSSCMVGSNSGRSNVGSRVRFSAASCQGRAGLAAHREVVTSAGAASRLAALEDRAEALLSDLLGVSKPAWVAEEGDELV